MNVITFQKHVNVDHISLVQNKIRLSPYIYYAGERLHVQNYFYHDLEDAYDFHLVNGDYIYSIERDAIGHIL